MSVSYGGDSITFGDGSIVSSGSQGFKNKIINGAMMIDQRFAGSANTPADSAYTIDRWQFWSSQSGKLSIQQSTTAPNGFSNSMLVTSLSSYSVASTDEIGFTTKLEGYNIVDLAWGTSDAKTVSLSFWVRSSLTGTFGGSIGNSGLSRVYVFSYTINQANTWEYKTITITGETSGTWEKTNALGLSLNFQFGAGSSSTRTQPAGSWYSGSTSLRGASGQVNLAATSGATWYMTGLQLEKGTTASTFEFRSYQKELILCYRYFLRYGQGTIVGSGASDGGTNLRVVNAITPVSMRAAPSYAWNNVYTYSGNLSNYGFTGVGSTVLGPSSVKFDATTSSSGPTNAMLTVICDGSSSYFTMSAEL
jgi:hypothetical protein